MDSQAISLYPKGKNPQQLVPLFELNETKKVFGLNLEKRYKFTLQMYPQSN